MVVQPLADAPLTDIGEGGTWKADIHGGAKYAVLLVKSSHKAEASLPAIPPIGTEILAVDEKPGSRDSDQSGSRDKEQSPATTERLEPQKEPAKEEANRPATGPAIDISNPPNVVKGGPDETFPISGAVTGVPNSEHSKYKVVIYSYAGGQWWVQPLADSPLTDIGDDGTWQTDIHGGSKYAAMLVKSTYAAKPTLTSAPKPDGDQILAVDTKPGKQASDNPQPAGPSKPEPAGPKTDAGENRNDITKQFSGYDWTVKTSGERRVGPGPNRFSADAVFVDDEGLHLRIFKQNGLYYSGEVISKRSFGYGTYHFTVGSNIDDLDPYVILGMFTWSDDPAYSHREIDVEISRWGKEHNENAQYVVQPYSREGNLVRFSIPPGLAESTYSFTWKPDSIVCRGDADVRKVRGRKSLPALPVHEFTRNLPRPGNENVRINLWLKDGHEPGKGDKEVVIRSFRFEPLS